MKRDSPRLVLFIDCGTNRLTVAPQFLQEKRWEITELLYSDATSPNHLRSDVSVMKLLQVKHQICLTLDSRMMKVKSKQLAHVMTSVTLQSNKVNLRDI